MGWFLGISLGPVPGGCFFADLRPIANRLHARRERNFKVLNEFYQEVIDEHMNPNRKTPENEDIVDVLLQLKKQRSFFVDLSNDHIKAVLMVWSSFPLSISFNSGKMLHKYYIILNIPSSPL